MSRLYNLQPDALSQQTLGVLKNALLLRHPVRRDELIPLQMRAIEYTKGLSTLEKGDGAAPGKKGLIVGVVRMGYGHYRMAYAAATWAMAAGRETALHDLLAIKSPGGELIKEIDQAYSFFSRISADVGGPLEWAWGLLMSRGDVNSLFFSDLLARELTGLIGALPKELPVVSAYPLHAQIAVHAGFRNVVNMVPDNFPQYFVLAPGALNLVQGPAAYSRFREMGAPADAVAVAGHWVSREIAVNAIKDSERRIDRAGKKQPRRILLPIGGAGAQRKLVLELIEAIAPKLIGGEIKLLLNAGDHKTAYDAFVDLLRSRDIPWNEVRDWDGLSAFVDKHGLGGVEPSRAVTLFHFDSHYPAFAATDLLMRCADILATKPSELAFFPIPKLFLRRVGDHEAASALRSQELGEGTPECRETDQTLKHLSMLCESDELFVMMNEAVIRHAKNGVYDGAKFAVETAIERSR